MMNAQNKQYDYFCGTDDLLQNKLNNDNQFRNTFEDNNTKWEKYAIKNASNLEIKSWTDDIILPVAIHDLSGSNTFLIQPGSNISKYQYIIDALNIVYQNQNTGIQFCLAKKDINGDFYDFDDTQTAQLVTASNLDKTDYLQIRDIVNNSSNSYPQKLFLTKNFINIYIVDNIEGPVAGFAYLPSSHGSYTIKHKCFIM